MGPFQLETMFYSIEQDLHRLKFRQPKKKNLTQEEYKSIKSLKTNPDIIIKPADKGSAIVILNKDNHIAEGERQLQDKQFYEETNTDLTGEVIHRVSLFVNNMLQRGQITEKTSSYLTTNIDRTQQLYLLPKIHKDMNNPPGRPIVSGSGGAYRENISICRPFHWSIGATFKVIYQGLHPYDQYFTTPETNSQYAIMHFRHNQSIH